MAKTLETSLTRYGDLGFDIGQLIPKDTKIRLETNWFGYTIDLGKTSSKKGKGGGISIMNLLKPAAIISFSGKAYKLDPNDPNKISEVDPRIFNTPTFIDKIMEIGIVPIVGTISISGILLYMLLRKGK